LIGRKAWFGPRQLGWGLGPASTEGWILTVAFTGLAILTRQWQSGPRWVRPLVVATFVLVVILKGTSPGGAHAHAEFQEANETGSGS
jgi:hypothetical protein